MGAVLGWPNLDYPVVPGGEGLGWHNTIDGAEFMALGVTIPRLDDRRKTNYNASVARYVASKGQLLAMDDITGDQVRLIDAEGAQQLRAAAMMADNIPFAQMEPVGLDFFVLKPGERALVPVQWNNRGTAGVTEASVSG